MDGGRIHRTNLAKINIYSFKQPVMDKVILLSGQTGQDRDSSSSIASSRQSYTMSDAAREQRAKNAQRKRWVGNLKVLSEKFSWKVDEYKLINEIVAYMEQTFTFAQLSEIFSEEFQEMMAEKMQGMKDEHEKEINDFKGRIAEFESEVPALKSEMSLLMAKSKDTVSKKKFNKVQKENMRLIQEIERQKRSYLSLRNKYDELLLRDD